MTRLIRKICINCPAGCHLEIETDDSTAAAVPPRISGNRCPRGEAYARQELTDPRRTVTAVAFVRGGSRRCVPVKSTAPVPMALVPRLLEELYRTVLEAPVHAGQVVLPELSGTEIKVIATDDVDKK